MFNSVDAHKALIKLYGGKIEVLGRDIIVEKVVEEQSLRKDDHGPPLPAGVAHLSDPEEQFAALAFIREADSFNRAALKDWFMEERDLNLDI